MSNSDSVSRKAYPTGASGLRFFSGVRVAHLLVVLCMYYIGYVLFFVVCLSVFQVLSLSLDYIPMISARILVPLITLSNNVADTTLV